MRFCLVGFSIIFCIAILSCGSEDRELTQRDKFVKIAIQEDTRDLGDGEFFEFLTDPDPLVRLRTVKALGRIGAREASVHVAEALTDSVEVIRQEAAFALGLIGGADALLAITANLSNEQSPAVKIAMIEALGRMGDLVIVAALTRYVDDPDPTVRSAVVRAFARLPGHGRTVDLVEMSRDSIADVRAMAAHALMRTGKSSAFGRLRWCLKDSDPLVRYFAARALGVLGDSSGLSHLTDRLRRESNSLVKISLIRSISQVGDRRALKALLNILSGKHSIHVKAEALKALGLLKLSKSLTKLKPYLDHENITLRAAAIVAAARMDPQYFMGRLDQLLEDSDYYVKSSVIDGLSEIKSDSAHNVLVDLFDDPDGRLRRQALSALADSTLDNVKALVEDALHDDDFTVQVTAIEMICAARDSSLIDRLAGLYRDHASDNEIDIRLTIVRGLASWIDSASPYPAMMNTLEKAVDDRDYHIRESAIAAFDKIGIDRQDRLGSFDSRITTDNYSDIFERFDSNPTATIRTNRGDIAIELLYDIAPKTIVNFVDLATSGFYDNKTWHRVIPGFVIQDGCPRGDGWGGPGYSIRCEYNMESYTRGAVGMAHSGKDTGGSQFFIAHTSLPHLDGGYTLFGRVVSGMRVVDRIEAGDSIRTISISEGD